MLRKIFVLDILDGDVVHAVRGERENYGPIHLFSEIVDSSEPMAVVRMVKPREVYIADLNRLKGTGDNREIIREISNFCSTMLDWGVKDIDDLRDATTISGNILLGTETASLHLIEKAAEFGISVSIDIKDGMVLSRDKELRLSPLDLIEKLNEHDLRDLIVLNMNAIGTKSGIDRKFLEKILEISEHNVVLGGGIKEENDLLMLEKIGLHGALFATAVHDGSIPLEILK
ncbi:MAG: HisA/HisF-related TIM barrel protein [Halobacteriota archaeon]|nr:HisA/HisF-related TIM barrel protein [Halobacteriota archaeon]